VKRNY